jgi:flagellar biosynthesis/type III secretory pathway protein FliH
MILHSFLEDFGSTDMTHHPTVLSDEALENERLEAFDKGYRAGWDDAIKAKAEDNAGFSDEFSQNLQDLSFTYHDVHAQVLSNLHPLFEEILQKILPRLAHETLGAHIAEQLSGLAREIGTASVEILVPVGASEKVTQIINEAECNLPISVSESQSLQEGQAELRLGAREIAVDLADVSDQITQAVRAVLYASPERQAHG